MSHVGRVHVVDFQDPVASLVGKAQEHTMMGMTTQTGEPQQKTDSDHVHDMNAKLRYQSCANSTSFKDTPETRPQCSLAFYM